MSASVYDIITAASQFTGDTTTAGLLMYVIILVLILVFMRNSKSRFFFIAMPVTLIASAIGILQNEVMYLILIINLIGIVIQYRRMS